MKAQKYITKSTTTEDVFLDGRAIGSLPQLIRFVSSKQYFGNLEYLKVVTATLLHSWCSCLSSAEALIDISKIKQEKQ